MPLLTQEKSMVVEGHMERKEEHDHKLRSWRSEGQLWHPLSMV